MTAMLFKVLNEDGSSCHSKSSFKWILPQGDRPGEWTPPINGMLIPWENAYHVVKAEQILKWLGPAIFTVETRGEFIELDDKCLAREARLLSRTSWNERTARLWMRDVAEHVLRVFETARPEDERARQGTEAARRFAEGQATLRELAPAGIAAWAAWTAAREAWATWSAWATGTCEANAWVSWAAAWASGAAAWASWAALAFQSSSDCWTTWAAEREWQIDRLIAYILPSEETADDKR